ncbi:S-layer homology domain-containing protein [Paenibacillus sp. YIM B09110]|uniref:S-layer homology domain-containing protein n=1 Tax=Paenibacillus sp. YIM B09110 TaxID=3126102 RepID=UPI00301B9E91
MNDNPFTDTKAKEVIAANKLGILNGKGSGRFDPNGSITRQEAASMLTKTAISLGYDVRADASVYADNDSIAEWASSSVDFVSEFGIMQGTGNNKFSPKGTYTRQQAYMTIWRLYNALE